MKVGAFLPEIGPDKGGAFTFVETVLAGLLDSSRDSFVVFHYGSAGDLTSRFPHVKFVSLAASDAAKLAKKIWFQKIAAPLQAPLHMASAMLGRSLPYPAGSPLDRAARAEHIDLMWFPTPMYEPVDVPYIVTVWDLEHRAHPYFPELGAHGEWQARERQFTAGVQRASYVVTGTKVGRDELVRLYGVDQERIRILPHPTPRFALEARDVPRTSRVPTPYVFYPAQFWSHKNHVGIVRAIAELRRRGTIVHVAFVGSDKGNQGRVRACAAELGVTDQIHLLGFVERDELVSLYQHAGALVYASLCGPENLPPLEAMALGCPVINSDIPGAREQLGEAALLVDTLDEVALADAIMQVLQPGELRTRLVAGGRTRAARYTDAEFGRDLRALVDDFRRKRDLW